MARTQFELLSTSQAATEEDFEPFINKEANIYKFNV
jgi:hypothetical protein